MSIVELDPAASPLAAVPAIRPSLLGLTRQGLAEALASIEVPEREIRMRVNQLWHWIYFQGVTDFSLMTNVAKGLRARLAEHFTLARPQVVAEQISKDGTRKWLIRMPPVDARDRGA